MAPPPGAAAAAAAAATGKDTDREIDVQAYISKAQQRNIDKMKKRQQDTIADADLKPAAYRENVDLSEGVGQTKVVEGNKMPGFHCEVCDVTLKDSLSFLDHLNNRKHQRALGMSTKAPRATHQDVLDMLEQLRNKVKGAKQEIDTDTYLDNIRKEEEAERKAKKEAKKLKRKRLQEMQED